MHYILESWNGVCFSAERTQIGRVDLLEKKRGGREERDSTPLGLGTDERKDSDICRDHGIMKERG